VTVSVTEMPSQAGQKSRETGVLSRGDGHPLFRLKPLRIQLFDDAFRLDRLQSGLVRLERPTWTVFPTSRKSPPSTMPGGWMRISRRKKADTCAMDMVSALRESAPGRWMIVISLNTRVASSTKRGVRSFRCIEQSAEAATRRSQTNLVPSVPSLRLHQIDGLAPHAGQFMDADRRMYAGTMATGYRGVFFADG
jgi:hypothetical protein